MTALKIEVQEAICSALWQLAPATFHQELLGEFDSEFGHEVWWHIGEKPKDIRVCVVRPHEGEWVEVRIEWLNYWADARNPLKGQQTIRISTYAATQAVVRQPVEAAVVRVLEVYRDVLAETGVAGQISELVDSRDDSADPE